MSRIKSVVITPIAFRDPPLLNVSGIHEPWALRSIIEVVTEDGQYGLSESYGDEQTLSELNKVAPKLEGLDVFQLNTLKAIVDEAVGGEGPDETGLELAPGTNKATTLPRIFAAFEVAFLDLMGKLTGRSVCDLLGGKVRDAVPFSAYLFYKYGEHKSLDDGWVDKWGEVITPEAVVREARQMIDEYGFQSIKLKGGVFEPEQELAAVRALKEAFPDHPLRIDPNGGWTVETTERLMPAMDGLLQYLEDPTPGKAGMGKVHETARMPLATNMCVIGFFDFPEAIRRQSVDVILSDHHYWGGLQATRDLARICETWGLGLSMHSNSHLGISLMAMTHAAAAIDNLTYACDTHYPWQEEEVIVGGKIAFENGSVRVPDAPGLGVELDRESLAVLARNYQECGIRSRNDVKEMQKYDPHWTGKSPRF
ncbi:MULTISPECIES: glucarate dehydratase family protein [unclassified Modicisalibacter]|uniref:glucarate dehydratase family protein n=1 Tax=unclassified Modicisalibacter TaxID=2679913 RepID=UPI001CCFF98C|nr:MULTISPECIES: glucarate dehydratase family protein [unclassified Modicisalibacter]MBZ9560188.1 glucarate dehydratase [Modicisalibacter sp. R2A 31.J]MBZ9576096.1 glucarate dehydratase [Modicisalibacter sp. MOD 31.J]